MADDSQAQQQKQKDSIFGMSPEEIREYLKKLVEKIPGLGKVLRALEMPEHNEMNQEEK